MEFRGPEEDAYGDRLLKLVPAEVITLYMAMDGLIAGRKDIDDSHTLVIFAIGLAATWFYLKIFLKVKSKTQIFISAIAFAIWALNIGQGFEKSLEGVAGVYAAIALLVFTFVAPKIPLEKPEPSLPPL